MTNTSLNSKLTIVLTHAKVQDKWVAVRHLAPYGLHSTLVHLLEDNGYILCNYNAEGTQIKLTLKGYKKFMKTEEELS